MTVWAWGAVDDAGNLRAFHIDEHWVDEQIASNTYGLPLSKVQIALDAIAA
jgi:hypothetical protein